MTQGSSYYDFRAAVDNNFVPVPESFILLAEILSEHHDEGEYFWLIQDKKTKHYHVITGSHDYTGWDCQSGATISEPFKSLNEIHRHVQQYDNQNRPVRQMLVAQALDPQCPS